VLLAGLPLATLLLTGLLLPRLLLAGLVLAGLLLRTLLLPTLLLPALLVFIELHRLAALGVLVFLHLVRHDLRPSLRWNKSARGVPATRM
jgi:hypothetical protein